MKQITVYVSLVVAIASGSVLLLIYSPRTPVSSLILDFRTSIPNPSDELITGEVVRYIRGSVEVSSIKGSWTERNFKGFHTGRRLRFTDDELSHLIDVRNLVSSTKVAFVTAGLASAISWIVFKKKLLEKVARLVFRTFVGLGVLIGISVVLLWRWFFTLFHQILFPQGNWAFPADSLLIQLFPEDFWVASFIAWLFLVNLLSVAIWLIAKSRLE